METFEFYIEELRPQWWRYHVVVEAKNQEEAIQKAKNFDCKILDSDWLCSDVGETLKIEISNIDNEILYKE